MQTGCSAPSSGCMPMESSLDPASGWLRFSASSIAMEGGCGRRGSWDRGQRFSSPSGELVLDRTTRLGCLGRLIGLSCFDDPAARSRVWLEDGALACPLMDDELDTGFYRE